MRRRLVTREKLVNFAKIEDMEQRECRETSMRVARREPYLTEDKAPWKDYA